jgi:hypothetical protein
LSLADGKKQLWAVPIGGTPCGQGVACGTSYYLPIRIEKSEQYEVCKFNLETGVVESHIRAPKNEALGNLVFVDGRVISQNEKGLTCFSQKAPNKGRD